MFQLLSSFERLIQDPFSPNIQSTLIQDEDDSTNIQQFGDVANLRQFYTKCDLFLFLSRIDLFLQIKKEKNDVMQFNTTGISILFRHILTFFLTNKYIIFTSKIEFLLI